MKIKLFFINLLFIGIVNSQVKFEPGYVIYNNDQRVEFLIKNFDWLNNPDEIECKSIDDNGNSFKLNASAIKEFGIGETIVFKKFTVPLDMSSSSMVYLSSKKEAEFETRTLFLRQLVKGSANLYYYEGKNIFRFFFNKEDATDLKPLIYKKYKVNNTQVGVNAEFRNVLFSDLKCNELTANNFKKLAYHKNDLISIFTKYNTCIGADNVVYGKNQDKNGSFNFTIKGGLMGNQVVTRQEFGLSGLTTTTKGKIPMKLNVRIGVEGEYIFPFNNGKWSVFIEPSYQSYDNDGEITRIGTAGVVFRNEIRLKYSFIELPVGIRHYMFINENSKLFLNGGFVKSFDLNGTMFFQQSQDIDVNSLGNFFTGIGYNYQGKYSIELRVALNRNITNQDAFVKTDFSGIGLIMGYTLF